MTDSSAGAMGPPPLKSVLSGPAEHGPGYVTVKPSLALFSQQPALKRYVQMAVDRSIREVSLDCLHHYSKANRGLVVEPCHQSNRDRCVPLYPGIDPQRFCHGARRTENPQSRARHGSKSGWAPCGSSRKGTDANQSCDASAGIFAAICQRPERSRAGCRNVLRRQSRVRMFGDRARYCGASNARSGCCPKQCVHHP